MNFHNFQLNPEGTFFTSDTHWYHKNIIKYSNRPYANVEEMNEALVTNWNNRVKKTDVIFHLGDFGFAHVTQLQAVAQRLNGHKFLILGNHDHAKDFYNVFSGVDHYLEIKVNDPDARQGIQAIVLFHYSMRVWNKSHYGAWQLYGHSHGTLFDDPQLLSMDVGVDPCGYVPINYNEVKAKMKLKTFKPIDHHGKDR
jgi:calcineurin-like phosphoesterase family protein